ncbi:MAG: L,D-transpeptidase family protein [Adhaeribacter sp.]
MLNRTWRLTLVTGWCWLVMPFWTIAQTIHPQVPRLLQALEHYRQLAAQNTWASFPADIFLRPGDSSPHIPNLRHNLLLTRDLPQTDTSSLFLYDKALLAAVIKFQERHGLKADGKIGKLTIEAFNITPVQRIRQLEFNLRRWQADTISLNSQRVLLNIPDFTLKLLDGNYQLIWQTRVIVGQPQAGRQTALLTSKLAYLVLNPTWNIPANIIQKEIIPVLKKDPNYLARNQMRLYKIKQGKKYLVSVRTINWQTANPERGSLMIIQAPGKDNALGRIKFIFDNAHQIYLHDTPDKDLFNQEIRHYSHGCVRVQNPEILATYLLNQNWQQMLPQPLEFKESLAEQLIYLPKPLPLKIGYFTSWVNDKGLVQFRADIYNLDHFNPTFEISGTK